MKQNILTIISSKGHLAAEVLTRCVVWTLVVTTLLMIASVVPSRVEGSLSSPRRNLRTQAYFAYAYRIQNRLNKEMDMNRIETVRH